MDAIQYLLKDHLEMAKLFNQFVVAGEELYRQKKTIAEKIIEEIKVHVKLEEEIFYPAFEEMGGGDATEMVLEGIEHHRAAKFMMDRLEKSGPEDKIFDARFKALMQIVKYHFMEEEHMVFPMAKKSLEGELDRLGKEMDKFKKQMR